jgi:hypothetical protein
MKDKGLQEVEEYLDQERDKDQYDPHQREDERRELRVKYRNLTEKANGTRNKNHIHNTQLTLFLIEKRKELTAQDDGSKLYQFLDKANVLFDGGSGSLIFFCYSFTERCHSQKYPRSCIGFEVSRCFS